MLVLFQVLSIDTNLWGRGLLVFLQGVRVGKKTPAKFKPGPPVMTVRGLVSRFASCQMSCQQATGQTLPTTS